MHTEKYLKIRLLPKLMDDNLEQFRFYSCKFMEQKSKLRTARITFHREFGINECYTLEASMHGYIEKD